MSKRRTVLSWNPPRMLIVGSGIRRSSWQSKTTGSSETSAAKTSRPVKTRPTANEPTVPKDAYELDPAGCT